MYLVVCTYPNFSINKMLQRAIATYNLKTVYKICGNVSKLQYFSIYFSKISWGACTQTPQFQHASHAGKCALHTGKCASHPGKCASHAGKCALHTST